MRYLIYFTLLIILAAAAAVLSQLYLNEPVNFRYGSWSATPPLYLALACLLLAALLLFFAVRLLLWLLFLPAIISKWNKRRRREKQAQLHETIIRQLAYGERRKALKNLAELATGDTVAAWWAAQIADELGDARETRKYLQLAAAGQDPILSAAAKAKLCIQDNRLTEAENILKTAGAPRASVLLARLSYEAGLARGDYRTALAAAVYLRETLPAAYGDYVADTIRRQLDHVKNADDARHFWQEEVTKTDKKEPTLLTAYLDCLWRLGDEKAAGEGLAQALKQYPQDNAVLHSIVKFGTPQQRETAFKANEQRAEKAGGQDAALLRLMGELADALQLPGKARQYGQMLSALEAPHGNR